MAIPRDVQGRSLAKFPCLLIDEVVDSEKGVRILCAPSCGFTQSACEVVEMCLCNGNRASAPAPSGNYIEPHPLSHSCPDIGSISVQSGSLVSQFADMRVGFRGEADKP